MPDDRLFGLQRHERVLDELRRERRRPGQGPGRTARRQRADRPPRHRRTRRAEPAHQGARRRDPADRPRPAGAAARAGRTPVHHRDGGPVPGLLLAADRLRGTDGRRRTGRGDPVARIELRLGRGPPADHPADRGPAGPGPAARAQPRRRRRRRDDRLDRPAAGAGDPGRAPAAALDAAPSTSSNGSAAITRSGSSSPSGTCTTKATATSACCCRRAAPPRPIWPPAGTSSAPTSTSRPAW